jgi:polysaccharide biosynthesis protein PslG
MLRPVLSSGSMRKKLLNIALQVARPWRWYVRLAVVWIALGTIAPGGLRVLLEDPPAWVETNKSHLCVHTRLIDEVSEWTIQHSLRLVREMGATTIVEFFPWAYIENREGHYDWRQADRIVRHAQNQGITIIARMGLVPQWARPDDTTLNYIPDESLEDFAVFVAAFAARYAGIIDHIIVWNEPNLSFEWGYQEVDPARYVQMLRAVYEPVRAANPDVKILAGALAPTLEPDGSPHGLSDLIYLDRMYQAGAADFFDGLAIHSYGFSQPMRAEPSADALNFRRTELLYEIMTRYGDADKPVYITEGGWNDDPRWTHGVRPSQRIAYTLEAFEWAEERWPWLNQLCIWALRYPRPTGRYPDNFTLVTPDFQIKPIYYAIQAYARGTESSEALWLPAPVD